MSYSNSSKGKGGIYFPQQHPQQRNRYPVQRPDDIGPRQPRFIPQQAPRPQHPGPSQSPRVPSPSVSPVAVNPLPHDMNKQGAPSRPGMAVSPQQGLLANQPNHGAPPMLNMNPAVRFQTPRGVTQRFPQQQVPQQVYSTIRHQTPPHMQGIQHHPQAGTPQAQQGANTAQLMQSNAGASGPYVQPGQPQFIMTGPVPIVQQLQQRPFPQQGYQPVYQQPTTSQYYSSPPPQPVWIPGQPAPRPQFTQAAIPTTRPDSQRNKKIIRIVDPTTNQDVTDTLMRDASGSNSPHSGRSSANVTPPVSTSSEDAKRIQAQFAANVAMVASDIPADMPQPHRPPPVPQSQQAQQPPQPQQAQLIPGQPPQQIPGQPPQQIAGQPPQQIPGQPPQQIPGQPPQQIPGQQPQQIPGQPPQQQAPMPQPVLVMGGAVPLGIPGIAPAAVVPPGQIPSQPTEPSIQESAQVTTVAATPGQEATQPPRAANVQPVPTAGAPSVGPVDPAQLQQMQQQQARMPAVPVQQIVPVPQPVAAANPPPQNPAPVQPTPPTGQAMPPQNVQTVPPPQVEAVVKQETPVESTNKDNEPSPDVTPKASESEQVAAQEGGNTPVSEAQPTAVSAEPEASVEQVDSGLKDDASVAEPSAVKPVEPAQPVTAPEPQESANPENKESKKKSQKKRFQELDKKPAQDSDEFAAYKVDDASVEQNPASNPEKPKEEGDVTPAPEATNPQEPKEKLEEKPSENPKPTTQPEEPVPSEKTEDKQSDVAKRKSEKDSVSEKPVEVVPDTTPAKLDTEEKVDRNEADDRDNVNEADTVESENTKNKDGKPNPKDSKMQLKYTYREDQWSPKNPEGKKQYGREFLLQFQNDCTGKPDGLPNIPDIVLDKAEVGRQALSGNLGMGQKGSDFMPAFMKSPRPPQGKQLNYPVGQARRPSKEPKHIQRLVTSQEAVLPTTDKAWKPGHKRADDDKDENTSKTDELFRNFTSILNKLTPQRFQKLVEQALQLPIDTEERLKGVTSLVFEKAISEPSFSTAYAHMCQRLSQIKVQSATNPATGVQFRPILLHNCQREFEKEKQTELDEEKRRKEIVLLPHDQQALQLELLNEKLSKAKRRTMGNMRFIGELYKLRILTENIMHECILKLLKAKDDDSLECLCNLMATIGKDLDHEKAKNRMDQYFSKIDKIIASKKNPPRIRFLMCDLVDLRKNNWVPRRQENKPTTIDAIHRDFHLQEAKKAEDLRGYKGPSSRSSREHVPPPRSGPPQAEDGWNTVPTTKTRTVYDPSKLKLTRIAADDNIQLGPGGRGFNMWTRGSSGGTKNQAAAESGGSSSQDEAAPTQANRFQMLSEDAKRPSRSSGGFGSRDSRGRGQSPLSKRSSRERDREREREKEAAIAEVQKMRGRSSRSEPEPRGSREKISRPPKPEEPAMTDDKVEQKSKAIVDEFLNLRDFAEAKRCVAELPSKQRHLFVQATVDHIIEKKQDMREAVGVLFQELIAINMLTHQQYLAGLSMIEFADDMAIDIPKIYEYLGEIQGAMVAGGADYLKLQATAIKPLLQLNKAGILLAEILKTASRRKGASEVCHIWRDSGLRWEDFLPAGQDVKEFVQSKGIAFTIDGASTADNGLNSVPTNPQGDWLSVLKRGLPNLLKSRPENNKVFDWIEHNVTEANKKDFEFIRALVTIICENTAEGEGQTCRIDPDSLKLRSPVLQRYINNQRPLEVQALYAVQALNHSLQNPPGLLGIIFDVLYDEDVIPEEAFYDWKKSEDPKESAGKGVALKSVTSFFTWLTEAD